MPTTRATADNDLCDAPALLAIIRAAKLVGDRDLERAARRLLREQHGIDLSFRRSQRKPCPLTTSEK